MKNDTSKEIDLDSFFNEDTIEPQVVGGAMGMEPIALDEPVEETIDIDIHKIVTEWSYRLPAGYPKVKNGIFEEADVQILNNVLNELYPGIKFDTSVLLESRPHEHTDLKYIPIDARELMSKWNTVQIDPEVLVKFPLYNTTPANISKKDRFILMGTQSLNDVDYATVSDLLAGDTVRDMFGNKAPNVYLLHGDLTDEEMNSLYNHSKIKAMVSFTHGEGYGRPLQEFALTGKPVLTSNWSGHIDFLKPEYHTLLPGGLTPVDRSAVNDWILKESQWFTVNYQYAAQVFKHIVDNYKDYFEKSRKGVKYLKDNFSIEAMDTKFAEILNKYEARVPETVQIQMPKLNLPKLQKV